MADAPKSKDGHSVWESLFGIDFHDNNTTRLRVPGGWLYHRLTKQMGASSVVAMCFVPDPPACICPECRRAVGRG